jgi:pimeloyl-ACP methyl ester carboxylesterase
MTHAIASRYAELSQVTLHYLEMGEGYPVVLLHGIPQSSFEWRHVMPRLAEKYRVIAPDLRGLGDTSRPSGGYDKKTVAADIWELVSSKLGIEKLFLVGHDWGGPVAFSLAAHHPEAVEALSVLDVTIPGDGGEMSQGGKRWHHPFFRTRDLPEALCAGREHLVIDWLFENYGRRHDVISVEERREYHRTYSRLGGFRAMISYYRAFPQDVIDNQAVLAANGKLRMPVMALGGDSAFGRGMETYESLRRVAEDVKGGVIPECGHWVAEEAPDYVVDQLMTFFSEVSQD